MMTETAARRLLDGVVDWRRLLIAVPVLAVLGMGLWVLLDRGDATATTPRAVLQETAPVGAADPGVRTGQTARDFIASTDGGPTVRLSDFRGKPVIVNFWATWCTSCLVEMPDLRDVQREFGADNVAVLAVNSGESRETARGFIEDLGAADFTYAFDPTLAVTDAYGIIGLSHTVFVDADGVIRATYTGQMAPELMREYVVAAAASTTAGEPPFKLRLPGSVEARTSLLVVEEFGDRRVRLSSKRLRCDDTFCAAEAVDRLAGMPGITSVEPDLAADPPSVIVTFSQQSMTADRAAESLIDLLDELEDPLYQHEIAIERQ
jgi:peroxiredoxin